MAIIESVVVLLLEKLADKFIQEAIFVDGVREQVKLIVEEFGAMQSFLKDADTKQGDERVKHWVQEVRDVAYHAEDVIDTFVFKAATLRRRGFMGCIRRYACILNELLAHHKLGSEIKQIENKIHAISEHRSAFAIGNIGQEAGGSSAGRSLHERRLTSPYSPEPEFVGFKEDLEALIKRLTDKGELRRCVVSVVGMGGLGKTTLTKKVYNDTRVQTYFECCEWISISQEYDVRHLLNKIINYYKRPRPSREDLKNMDLCHLRHETSECLKKKKYLMVLDDIWTMEAWDDLKDAFPDVNNGSRVMLTTRNKDVALYADAQSLPHELQFLNEEQSWELFCSKRFPGRVGGCPQELEELGRQIVRKCGGLPLAITVIGGLLSIKEPREWENVLKSTSWLFTKGEVKISSILSMSYKDLSHHLKACFLYLATFPEDHEFNARELIGQWTAEGLLEERGDQILEEVGEDYLKELVQRSMVQVSSRSSSGGIKSCRIHDLLRDLCISEAKEGMFLQVHGGNANDSCVPRTRRLAIHHEHSSKYPSLKSFTPHLRSVLIYTQGSAWPHREDEKFLYRGFKLLRVLSLHRVQIEKLPREVGELIHLRYLGCTKTYLKRLPSSIGNLPNLQTLFVESSVSDIEVPSTIGKMQQLRHLRVKGKGWGVIEGHPKVYGESNVQTLSKVKAGRWIKGFLEKLTNLRKLVINIDGGRGVYAEVLYESIVKLDCLRSLRLHGKLDKLPLSTQFPKKLTKLTLEYCYLKEDPLATLEKLENLRILKLSRESYDGKEMACSARGFPRLESLHLQQLQELEEWRVEEAAMPRLLHLRIDGCRALKKLPEGLQHASTLQKLELWNISSSEFKARLREEGGEDWHKIGQIPFIQIT